MVTLCCTSEQKTLKMRPSLKRWTIKESFLRVCWPPFPSCWSHQSQSALLGWLAPHRASPSRQWSSLSASCPQGSLALNPPCCPSHRWWWRWKLRKHAHRSAYALTRRGKGNVLPQLYLSQWCRWSLRFPECRTKELRPESMCNMQARWWSTKHTETNTKTEHLQIQKSVFTESFHHLS